jgi:superfamily I DNA and/or RNA helicase
VPVVSTTFASFPIMFGGLGAESIGWLLIDEAGQAPPQQAAGAIWRAKRTVVVGDPMQLEPVVTLPWGGQQALLRLFDVPEGWAPSRTSVQRVADRLACYGTLLPGAGSSESGPIWVGTPLRVHRRCDRPMFETSNAIAYDGLMVFGTRGRTPFPGRDRWYDVRSGDARGHWIPAEGDQLAALLHELLTDGVEAGRIRVLSPFRQVAAEAAGVHRQVFGESCSADDRRKWVGTVHTMQGREADVVILVLGGNPLRPAARAFATRTPNLLNVAVTRARRRLYVIGNRAAWAGEPHFDVLARNLSV